MPELHKSAFHQLDEKLALFFISRDILNTRLCIAEIKCSYKLQAEAPQTIRDVTYKRFFLPGWRGARWPHSQRMLLAAAARWPPAPEALSSIAPREPQLTPFLEHHFV